MAGGPGSNDFSREFLYAAHLSRGKKISEKNYRPLASHENATTAVTFFAKEYFDAHPELLLLVPLPPRINNDQTWGPGAYLQNRDLTL